MDAKTFAQTVHGLRKAHRKTGGWYTFTGEVDGKDVQLKGYNTWLQIYRVNGLHYGNCMGASVAQYSRDLLAPF